VSAIFETGLGGGSADFLDIVERPYLFAGKEFDGSWEGGFSTRGNAVQVGVAEKNQAMKYKPAS